MKRSHAVAILILVLSLASASTASAQDISVNFGTGTGVTERVVQLVALITILSLAPAILVMVTSFTRIVVVLSLLRTAIGLQTAPPNAVVVSLALFLTAFVMGPAFQTAYDTAVKPVIAGEMQPQQAFEKGAEPFRAFMLKNVREKDLALFIDLSREAKPESASRVRYERAQDRVPDRIPDLPAVPDHRPRHRRHLDVDGHDDAAAGDRITAVQADLLRAGGRLEPGRWLASAELRNVAAAQLAGCVCGNLA